MSIIKQFETKLWFIWPKKKPDDAMIHDSLKVKKTWQGNGILRFSNEKQNIYLRLSVISAGNQLINTKKP